MTETKSHERDQTADWLLAPEARPSSLSELEVRIDHALAVARSSERAALEIGAAAIDAAEQARRAAELAETASLAAQSAGAAPRNGAGAAVAEPVVETAPPEPDVAVAERPEPADPLPVAPQPAVDALAHFTERADRVIERLRALERLPAASGDS